jgi:ent-kaurenoic acid hydroxylase
MEYTGYIIPKGWKVLTWFRSVHLDPEIYPNPKEFNPNRWNVSCKNINFIIELN